MEIRCVNKRPGPVFLAHGQYIVGDCTVRKSVLIDTSERWEELRPRHHWQRSTLPYFRCGKLSTYGLQLTNVRRVEPPVAYKVHRGAVGFVRYEAIETGVGGEGVGSNAGLGENVGEAAEAIEAVEVRRSPQ